MNTQKEKAEAYVREKLPELMELSFGCVVIDKYDKQRIVRSFTPKQPDKAWAFVALTEQGEWEPDYFIYDDFIHDFKILGHPIQLQHWLRVLTPYVHNIHFHGNMYVTVFTEKGEQPNVIFNLTTGQPATESDYKCFNDIVS